MGPAAERRHTPTQSEPSPVPCPRRRALTRPLSDGRTAVRPYGCRGLYLTVLAPTPVSTLRSTLLGATA